MDKSSVLNTEPISHVIAMQASAGSGKTYQLSLQFLKTILPDPKKYINLENPFMHILAITFTNKAANEMKERILKHLKMIVLDGDKNIHNDRQKIIKELGLSTADNEDLKQFANELVKKLLTHYSDFQVRTIDSFLRSIIAASVRETGLKPSFQISMDPVPYVEYAIDELLSKIKTDSEIKKDFLEFINVYFDVNGSRSFYPRNDIIKVVNNIRYLKNKKDKIIQAKQLTSQEIELIKDKLKESLNAFYNEISKNKIGIKHLQEKKAALKDIDDNTFSRSLWGYPNVEHFLKKGYENYNNILQPYWDEVKQQLVNLIKALSSTRYKSYYKILTRAEHIIKDITKTSDTIIVDDINTYVKALIENYTVPELFFNLGERILHYFIDEFQDTDRAQWNNIRPLVLNALANGGSLFYVGDKKQSIYRFKGSDAHLFDAVLTDDEIKPYGVNKLYLQNNYRSSRVLVDFFNETFAPDRLKCMLTNNTKPATMDLESETNNRIIELIDETYAHSAQTYKNNNKTHSQNNHNEDSGYISVECIKKVDNDQEQDTKGIIAERIKAIILELKNKGVAYSDIAILTRKNEDIKELSTKLKEDGIPVQSVRGIDIREHPLIMEIISFLNFINNPADNLSFVAFITGDIFTKASGLTSIQVYKWLLEYKGARYLYVGFKQWQPDLWEHLIKPLFNAVGYLPAYDIVNEFIERFKLTNNFPESIGFFAHLLEMLKMKEDDGENNLDSFIEYWRTQEQDDDNFFVRLSDINAVKLMTIHKAKGLEFPVVICPFVSAQKRENMFIINSEEQDNKFILSYISQQYINILYKVNAKDPYVKSYIEEIALSFIDELNAFYVALTRAKHGLYIILQDRDKYFYKLFQDKLNEKGTYTFGKLTLDNLISLEHMPKSEENFPLKNTPVFHWQNHIYIHQPDMDSLQHYKEEHRGNIIHTILSNITGINENIRENILEQLSKIDKDGIEYNQKFADNLLELINSPQIRQWFSHDPDKIIFTEKEVVDRHGELKRIDRLILTRDEAIIIDYKTGGIRDMEKHKKQVKDYMEIVAELYSKPLVKGYVVYVDHKRIEEVNL